MCEPRFFFGTHLPDPQRLLVGSQTAPRQGEDAEEAASVALGDRQGGLDRRARIQRLNPQEAPEPTALAGAADGGPE